MVERLINAIVMVTMMGLTWIFGYFLLIADNITYQSVMQWVFTLTNVFQVLAVQMVLLTVVAVVIVIIVEVLNVFFKLSRSRNFVLSLFRMARFCTTWFKKASTISIQSQSHHSKTVR